MKTLRSRASSRPGKFAGVGGFGCGLWAALSLPGLMGCTDEGFQEQSGALAEYSVRQSVHQLSVTHAAPETELVLLDSSDAEVARGTTDSLGSLLFRELPAQAGYRVTEPASGVTSPPLEVYSVEGSKPAPEFYSAQELGPGFQYIETRDGTRLSVYITLPGPVEEGPYPTVVNYSGYEPSKPGGPIGLDVPPACDAFPTLCDAPNDPSGMIAGLMGYATVSVNVRGTGCSGGAYDFFETLQVLDGYDVIETVGSQPWVLHNRVGMTGLSYPGISQLFVAQTRPPHLAAITPLSVIADTASSVLMPGGIYNDGFALAWADEVLEGAAPFGQGWEQARVDLGDEICAENQLLHLQAVDAVAKALANPFRDPALFDPLDPSLFADEIDVPVFMAGAWQDEQTGGHFPALFDKFTSSPVAKFTAYNGAHMDGFTPHLLSEWKTFLDLYVARTVPKLDPLIRTAAPLLFQELFGASLELGPDRFADQPSHAAAVQAYEAEDSIRIIFDVGAKPGGTSYAPEGAFEQRFSAWPIPGTEALRYYFNPDGSLSSAAPSAAEDSAASFALNPALARTTNLDGGNPGVIDPRWTWSTPPAGDSIAFETAVLTEDLVLLGHASADLWVRSSATDADLQVNVTEVLADGQEMYVQSGLQRASQRALASDATELRPTKTHLQADAEPLPAGQWELVRVEILPFGHVFRQGSKLRVNVQTPGGNHARWTFILEDLGGEVTHSVAHSNLYPSSVVFSHVPSVVPNPEAPGCKLRAQPCRPYEPQPNTPFVP